MDAEKWEKFKKAVAEAIQKEYPQVDYLLQTIPHRMDEYKHLLEARR